MLPFNWYTLHSLLATMVALSLAGVFAGVCIFSAARRRLDLLLAAYMFVSAIVCFTFFLEDNVVPAGADVWGPGLGGMDAGQMRAVTYWLNRSNWLFGLLFVAVQVHFAIRYCQWRSFLARHIWLLYAGVALFAPLLFTSFLASPAAEPMGRTGGWRNAIPWMPEMTAWNLTYLAVWFFAQTYSLQLLIRRSLRGGRRWAQPRGHVGLVTAGMIINAVVGTADFLMGIIDVPALTPVPFGMAGSGLCLAAALLLDRRSAEEIRQSLIALRLRAWQEKESERRSLARDLHDSLAQELAVLNLVLSTEMISGEDDSDQQQALARSMRRCRRLTEDLRHVCYGLFPPALSEKGLARAVDDLLEYCRLIGIEAELVTDETMRTMRLDEQAETEVFRAIQEAIGNASRHAHPQRIDVTLRLDGADLIFEVRDDGQGMDVVDTSQGLGMRTMRQRLERLQGRLELQSGPDGTCVRGVAPVNVAPGASQSSQAAS